MTQYTDATQKRFQKSEMPVCISLVNLIYKTNPANYNC